MKMPELGDMVLTPMDPSLNNGADIAAAFITRVWGSDCVNIKVIVDGHDIHWKSSVMLYDRAPEEIPPHHHYAYYPPRLPFSQSMFAAPPVPSSMGARAAAAARGAAAAGSASPEVQAIADAHSHPHRSVAEYHAAHPQAVGTLAALINGANTETPRPETAS